MSELDLPSKLPTANGTEDIFAEMQDFVVDVEYVDDSREGIYSPQPGE